MPQIYPKCPVNDGKCGRKILPTSKLGLCTKHEEWMEFLLWAIPKVRIEKNVPIGKLVVPGQEETKAILSRRA